MLFFSPFLFILLEAAFFFFVYSSACTPAGVYNVPCVRCKGQFYIYIFSPLSFLSFCTPFCLCCICSSCFLEEMKGRGKVRINVVEGGSCCLVFALCLLACCLLSFVFVDSSTVFRGFFEFLVIFFSFFC